MTRSLKAAFLGLGLVAASVVPALAQQPVIVVPAPAPAASPPTTTIVVPQGSTVTVTPPAAPAVAVAARPWCGGAYGTPGGTNFGGCPFVPR